MATDTKEFLETALALPAIDRVAFVESLLASLDQPDAALDKCWAAEARIATFEAGQAKAVPAEVVFKEFDSL